MNLYSHAARALNSHRSQQAHRSLPATRVQGASPYLGATRPRGNRVPPVFADVLGAPSIKMLRNPDGSVTTILYLNSRYADYMTQRDIEEMQEEAIAAAREARGLSQGNLTTAELRRRGHPYAVGRRGRIGRLRGARGGISNRAIVNKQSGKFARSWSGKAALRKSGGSVAVHSADRKSGWLAYGTPRMKAHYPGPTVMARRRPSIVRKWRAAARRAWAREMAMQGLQGAGRAPIAL